MSKMFDLTGKNALVTGSSQGIGFALAKGLAEAGARVIINGRDPERLQNAHKKLQDAGIETITRAFDVTDPKEVENAFTEMESTIGPIHILVANAGIMRRAPATEMPPETWREVLGTNLDGVWYCCQAAANAWCRAAPAKSSPSAPCKANWAAPPSRLTPRAKGRCGC